MSPSIEEIRNRFDWHTFARERIAGEARHEANGEWRVHGGGHGGLYYNPAKGDFCLYSEEGRAGRKVYGGDAICFAGYALFGRAYNNSDSGQFRQALELATQYAGLAPALLNGSANGAERPKPSPATPVARPQHSRPAQKNQAKAATWQPSDRTFVESYDYHAPDGQTLFHVDRYESKDVRDASGKPAKAFRQRPAGTPRGRERHGCMDGVQLVPYHLPQLLKAVAEGRPVYVLEGEKAVHAAEKIGLAATTNPGGAKKWRPEFAQYLRGAEVVILPDNDQVGRDHAAIVAGALADAARSVKIVELPGLPEKGDLVEWIQSEEEAGNEAIPETLACIVDDSTGADVDDDLEVGVLTPTWSNRPPEVEPVIFLNGHRIASIGNATGIIAGAGSGKSAVCEAIVANGLNPDCDGLGMTVQTDHPILYVDTERTWEDHWYGWYRTMRRAGAKQGDPRCDRAVFKSMKGVARVEDRMSKLERFLERIRPGLVILDGVGDFVHDVNDASEASDLLMWLLAIAETERFALVLTLHPNPQPGNDKPRGHLGSEVWRRAESMFLIQNNRKTKQRTITTKFGLGKVRNADDGLEAYFAWDDEAKMFLTCDAPVDLDSPKMRKLQQLAALAYGDRVSLGYNELKSRLMNVGSCADKTAKRQIRDLRDAGFLVEAPDKTLVLDRTLLDLPEVGDDF